MSCLTSLVVFTMIFFFVGVSILGILVSRPPCAAETPCADGQLCPPLWYCCEKGCCSPATVTPKVLPGDSFKEAIPYSWYSQWQVLFLLGTLAGILVCCIWCLVYRRPGVYMCSFACCVPRNRSEGDSAGSVYPPPRYSRCGSFHQAPPPYSEVTSKPDLYPLVITCGEDDGKAGSYVMVHYFRNYVIQGPGSISATSTADSLNSSFLCNAANEANTMVPPPYSCASGLSGLSECGRSALRSLSSLAEPRRREPAPAFRESLITSPVQPLDRAFDLELELIDCELYCDGGCKPRLGSSPPPRSQSQTNTDDTIYDQEAYGLRQLFPTSPETAAACESPPQPTSPTQSRDSTLRRQVDERRQRRHDPIKKITKARKSSLYMPLSVGYSGRNSRISPGSRMSSRSAPATPCGALVPNLLMFTQRVSASKLSSRSSRLEEENDPLLTDLEHSHSDHKF